MGEMFCSEVTDISPLAGCTALNMKLVSALIVRYECPSNDMLMR